LNFLIDKNTQTQIAERIDIAVAQVLSEIASHGNEEAMTSALGHALMQVRIDEPNLRAVFRYRQHNKYTEESHSGADGGFFVRIEMHGVTIEKASLFQAKLLRGRSDIRSLAISQADASRLQKQSKNMLNHTREAVAMFYTHKNIYVVDAGRYRDTLHSKTPLSQEHRLITLGTYLGSWMPRCTKGDNDPSFVRRARHVDGFKYGLSLDIISQRPSVPWEHDPTEDAWRNKP